MGSSHNICTVLVVKYVKCEDGAAMMHLQLFK